MSRPFNRVSHSLFRFAKSKRNKIYRETTRIAEIAKKGIITAEKNLPSFNPKKRKSISSTPMHSKIIKIINHNHNPKPPLAPNPTSSKEKDKETNFSYPIANHSKPKLPTITMEKHQNQPLKFPEKKENSISEKTEKKF